MLLCSEFFWNQVTFLHCHISNAMHYLPQIYSANEFNSYFSTFVWCANEPKNEHPTGVRKIKKKKKTMEKNTIIPTETNRSDKNISVLTSNTCWQRFPLCTEYFISMYTFCTKQMHTSIRYDGAAFPSRPDPIQPTNQLAKNKFLATHTHTHTHCH